MPENKTFAALVREALAEDPNWLYGSVLPLAKHKESGEYSAALPGMFRDYLTGMADLITGPAYGENLPASAVASMLGPGVTSAAHQPSIIIGPGAAAFNWKSAFRSPISGADEVARNTIDDSAAQFNDLVFKPNDTYKLDDFFSHPEFFENYPDAKNAGLMFDPKSPYNGFYNPQSNTVMINPNRSDSEITGTMLHELQHWVQTMEGMNLGGNKYNSLPQDFPWLDNFLRQRMRTPMSPELKETAIRSLQELDQMDMKAYGDYRRLPGEMEARAVQNKYLNDIDPPPQEIIRQEDLVVPSGWDSVGDILRDSAPYPQLPPPYNFLDTPPSFGQPFDPMRRQQYSPGLAALAKMLQESLASRKNP